MSRHLPATTKRRRMIDPGKILLQKNCRISEPLRPDHFEEFEGLSGDGLDAIEAR